MTMVRSGRADDFAGLDTAGADVGMFHGAVNKDALTLQVRQETTVGFGMGMTDGIP